MKHVLSFVVLVLFAVGFAIFLLDSFGGCGEVFIYADGSRHLGECVGRDIARSFFGGLIK